MQIRLSHIFTLMSVVAILGFTPAFALEQACPNCIEPGGVETAKKVLLSEMPIAVWTDKDTYDHNSIIVVEGMVANPHSEFPVTVIVVGPTNNYVMVDEVHPDDDGAYMTTFNTAGDLWRMDGLYTIKVHYNDNSVNDKAMIRLTGGVAEPREPPGMPGDACAGITIQGNCIPYVIEGGMVTGGMINPGTSIVIDIKTAEPGKITLSPASDVFMGLELVFIDGEQWDDIAVAGNDIMIYFPAGTQQIELVGSYVVPEFGAIAAMILAVALVSIIAFTARSRLGIVPRY